MRYLPRSVLDRSHLTRRLLGKPELAIERFIVMAALRHRDMSPSVHFAEAGAAGPVDAIPVKGAGRFVHEAVVWHQGILYQTEDQSFDSAFYRYVPRQTPGADRPLATTTGELQALKFRDVDGANTDGWPVGEPFPVEWVTIPEPDPSTDTVRDQAHGPWERED